MPRLSLRARLVLGVIVLSAAGLGAANVATYTSLRSFLIDRADQSLKQARVGFDHFLRDGRCKDYGGSLPRGAKAGDFIQIRSSARDVVCTEQFAGFADSVSPPQLPAVIQVPASADPERARYFTVRSEDGQNRYRVRVSAEAHKSATVIVASSLDDVDATLRRLLLIEGLVTGAVLAALAAVGLWVVRLGLRPLAAIGATAEAIAEGDLTKRVERAEERTEIGRLGLALNAMLGQIESGFKEKEASEQKLRRFVADASHELRTPLAAVRAYAELFERGAALNPDDLERSMTGIRRESERMSLLVEDLLLLARLDEGRPLERTATSLDGIVTEAVDAALAVEPDRRITTEIEPVVVLGDRDRLRQALDNLLANVRSHTPAGTPVHVRLTVAGDVAVVEVADEGPGMNPDDAARVFERFYRTDKSRARASGGVGLGLSIVGAIVEAHGGRAQRDLHARQRCDLHARAPGRSRANSQLSHSALSGAGASMSE